MALQELPWPDRVQMGFCKGKMGTIGDSLWAHSGGAKAKWGQSRADWAQTGLGKERQNGNDRGQVVRKRIR